MWVLLILWVVCWGNSKDKLVVGHLSIWSTLATDRLISCWFKGQYIRLLILVFGAIQLSVQKCTRVPLVTCHCNPIWKIFHPFIRYFHNMEVHLIGWLGVVIYLEIRKAAKGVWGWWKNLQAVLANMVSFLVWKLHELGET